MSTIKIGEKAKAILSSFSKLSKEQRIRDDYLYAKSEDAGTIGVYELPKGEVEIDEEFAIANIPEFLQIVSMFKEPEITKNDNVITIKDDKKMFSYITCPIDMVPSRNMKGQELFEASNETLASVIIDEALLKEINQTIDKLGFNIMMIVDDSGSPAIKLINDVTENFAVFRLEGFINTDSVKFGDISILKNIYPGIYSIKVKNLDVGSEKRAYIKLTNESIQPEDGALYYFMAAN